MSGRYKRPLRTKDSHIPWLGDIPTTWELKRFKNLFRIEKRIAGKLGFDVLSITQKGIRKKDTTSGDGQLSMDYSKYQIVQPGDFAMNSMDLLTGFVDISEYHGVTSPDYRVFTLEDKSCDPRYLLYLLQLCYIAKIFYPLGQGAAQLGRWRLPTEAFSEFVGPVPPLPEQTQIAKFLDHETAKIDRLIEKQEALIRLLKEKRQAVISHAVTKGLNPHAPLKDSGIEWLGQVPAHWDALSVKYVASKIGTGGTPKKENSFTDSADVPWFTPGDFTDQGELSSASKHVTQKSCLIGDAKTYPAGSVVVIGIGATLGKVGYSNRIFSCNQQINIITPNSKATAAYLMHALSVQTEQMRQLSNASTIGIINQEKTGLVKIAVPPPEEQDHIVEYIDQKSRQFAGLLDRASEQITLLQERRTALISAAVTGKIDVRHWQPPVVSELETTAPATA